MNIDEEIAKRVKIINEMLLKSFYQLRSHKVYIKLVGI